MEGHISSSGYSSLGLKSSKRRYMPISSSQSDLNTKKREIDGKTVRKDLTPDILIQFQTEPAPLRDYEGNSIALMEQKLKETKEKYEFDIENMQNYINLLRKKLSNNKSAGRSPDEQLKKEKEKALVFYKALKAKERECSELHKTSSINTFQTKIQLLMLEKEKLETKLFEAENELKKLNKEIKYKNETISSYKAKVSQAESDNWKTKYDDLFNTYIELQNDFNEISSDKSKLEQTLKDQSKKIEFLLEKIKLYESLQFSPKKQVKGSQQKFKPSSIDEYLNTEKLLESAKSECKIQIHTVAKDINEKFSQITLKAEQLENEETRLVHLLKLIKDKMISSGLPNFNKISKELDIAKQELEEALRENYDLHETLEDLNTKSLEKQEKLMQENSRLKEQLKKHK
ncbi:hypothetical protein SteCoe_23221 [Stentor coeruleus]|uniref:Uncharacterized protein n=1 Tax=Stentor coeruleus TaxID=5963 RepID=A0A1R2BKD7_9CILI|nr:hypothetical protein SteCoe_23221 [Stentor coeruleus]